MKLTKQSTNSPTRWNYSPSSLARNRSSAASKEPSKPLTRSTPSRPRRQHTVASRLIPRIPTQPRAKHHRPPDQEERAVASTPVLRQDKATMPESYRRSYGCYCGGIFPGLGMPDRRRSILSICFAYDLCLCMHASFMLLRLWLR